MNRKQFLAYFQTTKINDVDVKVKKYMTSATGHVSNA